MDVSYERRVEPLALGWRSFAWATGVFDTAYRPFTRGVEGLIRLPQHLVMVTLRGGAAAVEVMSSCGHKYSGPDSPGAVSFVPAHCARRLCLRNVEAEWASIALSPELFDAKVADEQGAGGMFDISAFTNREDRFVSGMLSEMTRLSRIDGALDATYCEAMSWALARYLARRYGQAQIGADLPSRKLAAWHVRRITAYVDANLAEPIKIAELADLVGVSLGYFHRAFQATLGKTPLEFINARRVQRAMQSLQRDDTPVTAVALKVGFASPGYFSRVFRRYAKLSPSQYRSRSREG
jgi:AraC family transcriptional regulator